MAEELGPDELGVNDLIQSIVTLRKEVVGLNQDVDKVITSTKLIGKGIEGATSTKQLRDAVADLSHEQEDLIGVQKKLADTIDKENKEYAEQTKLLNAAKNAQKGKTTQDQTDIKNTTKLQQEMKKLAASISANTALYSKMRSDTEKNSAAGKQLIAVIVEETEELDKLNEKLEDPAPKDYAGYILNLKQQLKLAKDEMAGIAATLGTSSQEFQDAAKRAGDLNDEIKDISEATSTFTGEPVERLGQAFKFTADKVKSLDFKGFKTGLKAIFDIAKANPFLLIVGAIVTIIGLMVALKDKIKPIAVLFNLISNTVEDIINKVYEWTDALGLTEHAMEKQSEKFLANMAKQRQALEDRYDTEIKLTSASHQSTVNLETAKARAIQDTTSKIIKELEKRRQHEIDNGKRVTDDLIKEYDERIKAEKKTLKDAETEESVLRRKRLDEQKAFNAEILKSELDRAKSARELTNLGLEAQLAAQQKIIDSEGKTSEERIAAVTKATQIEIQLNKNALNEKIKGYEADKTALKKSLDGSIDTALKVASEIQAIDAKASVDRKKSKQEQTAIEAEAAIKQRDILLKGLEFEAYVLDEVVNDEKESFAEREDALIAFDAKQKSILDISLKEGLITQAKYNDDLFNLTRKTTDTLIKLEEDRIKRLADAAQQNAAIGTDQELIALNKSLENRTVSITEYNKQRQKIEQTGYIDSLTLQLKYLEQERKNLEDHGVNTTALQQSIADTELAISDAKNQKLLEGETAIHEAVGALYQTSYDSLLTIIDNFNTAADEKRAAQSEAIQKQLDSDLAAAGDNEAKKVELKNKAEVEQQKIRVAQAAADRKRAIFEKASAAISIAINTAKGIGQALGTFPPPVSFVLAAITAALGAVQLAAVLSKPIPTYAEGTEDHPGGKARVGDAGPELVQEPGKKPFLVMEDTVMDLAPHTKVKTHDDTLRAIAKGSIAMSGGSQGNTQDLFYFDLMNEVKGLRKDIRNKRELHMNVTSKGVELMVARAESKTIQMAAHYE